MFDSLYKQLRLLFNTLTLISISILLSGFIAYLLFKTQIFLYTTVLFYRGLKIIFIATCIATIITTMIFVRYFLIDMREVLLSFSIPLMFWIVFFTHIPITAERSVTIFLLGYMRGHQDRTVSLSELENALGKKYIKDYGAIEKRLSEQLYSGTLLYRNGDYQITDKGLMLLDLYDHVARIMNLNSELLTPRQTDKCVKHEM